MISVGKKYRTRCGIPVYIYAVWPETSMSRSMACGYVENILGISYEWYADNGQFKYFEGKNHAFDLIEVLPWWKRIFLHKVKTQ